MIDPVLNATLGKEFYLLVTSEQNSTEITEVGCS